MIALPIAINPIMLVAIIGFVASTLSGILRQNRLPERDYINAGITAVFMVIAALVSLFVAGHALDWTSILAEVGVIMVGPGAALEGFLQVKVNTGIPLIDNEVTALEAELPKPKAPAPIVFKTPPDNGHAG